MNKDRLITMEEFKGVGQKPDLKKLRDDIENLRAMSSILKEHVVIMAGLTKAKYDALVAEGFTPQQAIDLCRGM